MTQFHAFTLLTILLLSIPTTYSQHRPEFTQNEYTQTVSEDNPINDVLLTVVATDPNNHAVTYRIEGDSHDYFELGETSGELILRRPLDREVTSSLDFNVIAVDQGLSPQTGTARVVIIVEDVNDNKPEFTTFPSISINEDLTPVSFLAIFEATDADSGSNAQIRYSISGDPDGRFFISALNGNLSLVKTVDYEVDRQINIVIVATDQGSPALSREKGLMITINDVDDTPPVFLNLSYTSSILENTSVGANFFTVLAMDQDGGANTFTYTIQSATGDGMTRFSIGSASGEISVAMALDFETIPSYDVVIHAQEITSVNSGQQTVTTTVIITIIDVNDEPPVLPPTVVGEASESIEIGHSVLQLTYTDPDTVENGYEFTVQTSGAKFNVSNTGDITVISNLDYETLKTEVFTVQMCEAINSTLCDTTSVSVTVTDENDNSPMFTQAEFTASITEEENNANILTITATDADDGVFGMVSYSITGTLAASFSVDANGQIDNIALIDRETDPVVVLTFIATDRDPDFPRQTSVPLTITVADINDQIPVFLSIPSPCAFDISESVNVDVFTFSVSDDDQAATANALALVTVNDTDFAVSGTHPRFTLMTNGILDREMIPSYTLLLTATDQGASPLSSDVSCTVTVTDVNDQTPSFSGSPSVTLKENRAVQTPVVTVSATDNDIGANARLTYEIELGNDEGLFFIDSSTGAISLQNSLDHETTPSYTLEVIAIDSAVSPLTGTGTVSITVTDVNDNTPVFGQIRYIFTITEGSAIATVVGTITTTDGDSTSPNNDITSSIQAGNTNGTFELTTSGEIRVLLPPVFDAIPSYTLTLVVIDMGTDPQPLSSTTTVEITVIDTNNNDPVLTNTPYSFTVTEGTHSDTPVGLVSASDIDSDSVTNFMFSLVLTPSTLPFAINPSSGLITTTANTIDRETTPLFTFTVIVKDNTVSPRQDSETITVQVVDVNDNHPVFMSTPYSGTIDENSAADMLVGVTVTATDGDIGANAVITYFIIGGNKNSHFKIDSATGIITTTTNSIDFEEIGTPVVLTIEARDAGIPSRATDITVSITITDLNDNPPSFLGTPYSTTVAEDTAIGTTVFTAIIDDADTTTITLTIISGNTGVAFRTDGMDVILKNALDRETVDSYSLVIQADDGSTMITTTLEITVSDVNDNDPVIATSNPASFSFPEDRSPSIITTIFVTDEDIGVNDDLYYELTNTFGIFSISQSGGVLSQIASFDFDTTETYMLEIIVRDGGIVSRSATHLINITITDLNDNTPTFTSDLYREDIDESQTVPYTFISNTMATDGDTNVADNGLISHSIVSVSLGFRGSFEINEQTGQLTLLNSLDYEVVQEIVLNIMAVDNAVSVGDRLSSITDVILTINDVNDNTPIFLSSIYRITIFENSNVPSTVGVFTARDIDSGNNGAITYSNSGMPSNFDYSSTTGVLTLNTNFDRDILLPPNPFMFTVIATDAGSSPRQNSSTVIVEILDQNDNAPMFNMASYSFSIPESTTFPVTVGTVVATETNDQGANAEIEYDITHGGEGNFVIDAATGVITTIRGVDRETEDTFELTVVAYDLGTNPLSTYVAVTITLDDINDNPPVFSFPAYHLNVTEGAANMDVFSSVAIIATDPDLGTNGEVTYSILDSNFRAMTVGLLATVQSVVALDFETTPHYQIEILAIDNATSGEMTGTATLFITLIDVNDNPPIFVALPTQTFSEATSGGSFLFQVIATDADSGINAEIQYSITAGNIGTKFSIQEDSGVVSTTTSPLDFETLQTYTLTITATGRGTSPMIGTLMVQIDITDSNDNAPMFGSDPFAFTAPENDASLTFNVNATDNDSTSSFKEILYSIRSGDEEGLFVINNMTGEISLSESLDRERPGLEILPSGNGLHRLIVQAQDKNRTEFTATTHVQISVTDLNDNHPSINRECPISLNVQEEVTVQAELLTTIPVTDADFGTAGEFTYVIASGNPAPRVFRINQTTGFLEVNGTKLDREMQPFYLLQLELRDMGSPPLTSTCMINVTVLDSNTHDPIFANEPNMVIAEDTVINTLLLTYTATDEDIGLNGDIIYTINSGNFGTKFKLEQFDGKLTVIGTLDFENIIFYTLEILAIDRGTPPRTGTGMITINITDVNDNAPVLVENTATSIREDISNGVLIYTAIATDADSGANQMIEYRILNGNVGMIFALNLNTGNLTIDDNTAINREIRDEYVLTISARDKGTPQLEDILNLTITVTDFNDETPYFLDQNLSFAIIEDTAENNYTGQIIITLSGNDFDIGLNGEFTFRIDGGNRSGPFSLSSDGVLTRLLSIDRETFDDFNLTIAIVDKGTPPLYSSMIVYIDITDSNDHTPIFSNITYTFSTSEDTALSTVIGKVGASDQDEGTNRMIVYVIPDITIPFSVNSSSGMLSVSSFLDREARNVCSFDIEGYDGGVHPRTGTTNVIVNILDVNDNQPYFLTKSYDFTIPENYPISDTFGLVEGTDSDITPNNVLYYHVLSGGNHTMVGLNSGLLSIVRNLDRESADFVTGSILVTNTAFLPNASVYNYTFSRAEISITLTDLNDNPPIFNSSWYRRGVISTTEYESVVAQVFADDADLVNGTYFGGEIRFSTLPPHVNTDRFRLNGTNGNIHVIQNLVPDVGEHFDLYVNASDNRMLMPHYNDTTRVTLWVITADLQIVITIQQTKPEVEMNINRITEILENITHSFINIDQVIYNSANNEHTDIYFHAVDKESLGIVSRDSIVRVVDENRISIDSLFKDVRVSEVRPATSPVILLDPVLLVISIVLAFLVVICCCLLILCIIYDQVRRKQLKHRQRVSLLKSYDTSLDYNYSLSGQAYENPMWLHPYEQWEKEDEFTKGNPLFYESREFIMDMFRESDDEKSEETVSFGSWGASQAKMRARVGISGMSKASTLTRMSDVDQDYNVELLAEVLGDDLPPSGDEPSEISNI